MSSDKIMGGEVHNYDLKHTTKDIKCEEQGLKCVKIISEKPLKYMF